jgi:hypothetical protein
MTQITAADRSMGAHTTPHRNEPGSRTSEVSVGMSWLQRLGTSLVREAGVLSL